MFVYVRAFNPKESHLSAVKKKFRYLSNTVDLGLWFPKDTIWILLAIPMLILLVVKLIERVLVDHVTFLAHL